jgi:hypothetical protein
VMISALLLALQATELPPEPPVTDEEIVVIASRLNEITARVSRDPKGRYHCGLSGSTGRLSLDKALCKTVTQCVKKGNIAEAAVRQCVDAEKPKLIAKIRKQARKKKSS